MFIFDLAIEVNMFLISNKELDGQHNHKFEDYFIYTKNVFYAFENKYLFIFDGYLYPDVKYDFKDLIDYFLSGTIDIDFKKFKGRYSGVFINFKKKSIIFFNDQLGLRDIFYYLNNDDFIISNSFAEITNRKMFNFDVVDIDALNEFLIFEYPLLDNTFIMDIKILPLASIFTLEKNVLSKFNYWKYQINENYHFEESESIKKLDKLFDQAMNRIKKLNGNVIYGLGLSGGRDSRLVAYYAKKNGMNLKTFTIGDRKSDAFYISKKLARRLNLEHFELKVNKDFIKYSELSLEYNPMMNLLYNWIYSAYDQLPSFDLLLTGFNGDNQMGGYVITNNYVSNEKLSQMLVKKYGMMSGYIYKKTSKELDFRLKDDKIINFLENVNISSLNKTENFNYQLRQLKFIKNHPSFNFSGLFDSFSPFEDIDLVEFLLSIPFNYKLDLKFYRKFHEKKLADFLDIRTERGYNFDNKILRLFETFLRYIDVKVLRTNFFYKESHKNYEKWLEKNDYFYEYCSQILKSENKFFEEHFNYLNMENELKKIYNGDSSKLQFFLRLIHIKMWLGSLND